MNDYPVMPFPFAVVNGDRVITDFNNEFKKSFYAKKEMTENAKITDIAEDFNPEVPHQNLPVGDVNYRVYSVKNGENYNVFFIRNNCSDDCEDDSTVVGLLLIDNYAEAQEATEETRFPHLAAVLEKEIYDYFFDLTAVIKKYEKDKFIFVLKGDKLDFFKESCSKLSEKILKVDLAVKATLSIGLGVNGSSLMQNMEYARSALDLALGRGGNQVVIRHGENAFSFIGGDGDEPIKTSNAVARARSRAVAFSELIMAASNVVVMGHKNPDLDSLGAAAGVFAIANFYGKNCKIVLNEVTSAIKTLHGRLMRDSKYTDVFIDSETAKKIVKRKTLLVVVDNHRAVLCECPEILKKTKRVVVIDHHRKCADAIPMDYFAFHDSGASSASELVTLMIMNYKGFKPTKTEIEGLLAGITVDTKNFAFKTSVRTFEAAAFLKRNNAETVSVRKLFKNSLESYKARTSIVCNAEIFNKNMAISFLTEEVDNPPILIAQAADEMLNINGIETAFVLCKVGERVHISARSLKLNVQKLMEKLGGGGHQNGAAAQLDGDMSLEDAAELLKEKIDELVAETKNSTK
jgi:c-di-AMP phosphodiesterase-like protein